MKAPVKSSGLPATRWFIVPPFSSIFQIAFMAIFVHISGVFESLWRAKSRVTTVDEYHFMAFHDDKFNFLEFPELNSLRPFTLKHWYNLATHIGINVYEPLPSFIKAATIDLVGLNAHNLHIVSTVAHFVNTLLMWSWLEAISANDQKRTSGKRAASTREKLMTQCAELFVCAVFLSVVLHLPGTSDR
jgi:hypothetical protein